MKKNYRRLKDNFIMMKSTNELNEKENKKIETNKTNRENNGNAQTFFSL